MPDAPEPKPKRRRTLLRRLLMLALTGGLLFVVGVGIAAWWAYHNRVTLANRVLQNLEPIIANAGGFEFDREGNIEVSDFAFGSAETPRVVELPSIKAKVTWSALARGEIESITIDHPDLDFTEGMLAELMKSKPAPSSSGSGGAFKHGIKIHRLDIEKASVSYQEKDGSIVDLIVSCHAGDIHVSEDGKLSTGDQEFIVEEGAVSHKQIDDSPFAVQRLHVKGRLRDGFIELDDFTCDAPAFHLRPELIALFLPKVKQGQMAVLPANETEAEEATIKGIRMKHATVRNFQINTKGFGADNPSSVVMPDASASLTYEADQLDWPFASEPTVRLQRFHLQNIDVHPPTGDSHLRCSDALVELARAGQDQPWHIEHCNLDGLDVSWTRELRQWLTPPGAEPSPAPEPSATTPPSAPWSFLVKKAQLTHANVRIADEAVMPFELDTKGVLQLTNLTLDNNGWHSADMQALAIENGRCVFPPETTGAVNAPFFELPRGELKITPDEWNAKRFVQKLALVKPTVRLRKNTPWLGPALVGPPFPIPVEAPPAVVASGTPWWQQLQFEDLKIESALLDVLTEDAKALDAQAKLDVSTQKVPDGNVHHILVQNIETKLPTLSKFPSPVLQAESFEASIQIPEMWQTQHIEELHLTGMRMTAGHALMKFFETPKVTGAKEEPDQPKSEQSAGPSPHWYCGHISVGDSVVTLENVVPGIPSVRFGVEFDVEDAPLTPEALARNVAPQQVEVANLKIPSPYEPLRSVAELDSIFIDFSLEGLMRKEIGRVQMVSPTLFVGEDLFWYVDFYRKFAATGAQPTANAPALAAAVTGDEDFVIAGAVIEREPAMSDAPWSVRTLEVHAGKLVLAPKGTPLPGFRTPFPFSFTSELKRGTMEADFEIPPDTYIYEDMKLQFEGMKGRVQFNLPVKGKDNNLTEVFEVDRIRWKQMHVEKAFLSVTYDANGIYGKLGGSAYDGYVNGQFNIYLDDSFTWDGWISGTNVQLHEITQKLMPGYFLMDGQVEGKIIAAGDKNEIYQADGKFLNHTPGRFSIAAMNEMLEALPKEWAALQRQMTQIGLETLRDFQYDQTVGDFRLYGREGKGQLSFKGPAGSRNFEVNVFDHRWKTDDEKEKPTIASDAKP